MNLRTAMLALAAVVWSGQPVIAANPARFAKEFNISFVTAYEQCTGSGLHHNPPLAFFACTPVPSSSLLTFGDHGAGTLTATLAYRPGHGTADVKFHASLLHVEDPSGPFTGTVNVKLVLRVTDEGCTGPGTACTLPEFPLTIPVACGGVTSAGRCLADTTFNTVVPGALAPGLAARLSVSQAWVEYLGTRVFEGGLYLP